MPYGVFQFQVMPFGFQQVPATFERMMDILFSDVSQFAAAYLDDIIIYSQTSTDPDCQVREILHHLRGAGLIVKLKKCQFAMSRCSYLGHVGNGKV